MWRLPNTTKGDILAVISDSVPVFDELCRRFLNFVFFHVCIVVLIWLVFSLGSVYEVAIGKKRSFL